MDFRIKLLMDSIPNVKPIIWYDETTSYSLHYATIPREDCIHFPFVYSPFCSFNNWIEYVNMNESIEETNHPIKRQEMIFLSGCKKFVNDPKTEVIFMQSITWMILYIWITEWWEDTEKWNHPMKYHDIFDVFSQDKKKQRCINLYFLIYYWNEYTQGTGLFCLNKEMMPMIMDLEIKWTIYCNSLLFDCCQWLLQNSEKIESWFRYMKNHWIIIDNHSPIINLISSFYECKDQPPRIKNVMFKLYHKRKSRKRKRTNHDLTYNHCLQSIWSFNSTTNQNSLISGGSPLHQ